MPIFCCRQRNSPSTAGLIVESDPKTDWKSIYIVTLVAVIGTIHTQCLAPTVYPYMKVMIPDVNENFYGILVSLVGFGTLSAGLLGGWISNLLENTAQPMIVAKFLALISCLIYMSVEIFNEAARRALFIIFQLFFGFASGAAQTYHTHVAMASTEKDRPKAVAICSLAPAVGTIIAPVVQIAFTALGGYPGLKLLFGLHLNMYTTPVYIVLIITIIGALLLIFCFDGRMRLRKEENNDVIEIREEVREVRERLEQVDGNMVNLIEIREETKEVNGDGLREELREEVIIDSIDCATTSTQNVSTPHPQPKPQHNQSYDKLAVFICLFIKMVVNLSLMMFTSVGVPYSMMAFGWTSEQSLLYISICLILIGINVLCWNMAYIFFNLREKLPERCAILIGVLFLLVAYLCTYPWPFIKGTIPYKVNETSEIGCPKKYEWCSWTPKVNQWVFLGSIVIALGITNSLCNINIEILYSKILGNIKQGTLQGVMVACGEIMNIIEPLFLTQIYTLSGPTYIWDGILAIIVFSIILWIVFYKRMIGKTERLLIEQESTYL